MVLLSFSIHFPSNASHCCDTGTSFSSSLSFKESTCGNTNQ